MIKCMLYKVLLCFVAFLILNFLDIILLDFRKKDVSLGSHNPLCDYSHPNQPQMSNHSSNSNNYTTINYNHQHLQVRVVIFVDRDTSIEFIDSFHFLMWSQCMCNKTKSLQDAISHVYSQIFQCSQIS